MIVEAPAMQQNLMTNRNGGWFSACHNLCWCSYACHWKHPSWAHDCG